MAIYSNWENRRPYSWGNPAAEPSMNVSTVGEFNQGDIPVGDGNAAVGYTGDTPVGSDVESAKSAFYGGLTESGTNAAKRAAMHSGIAALANAKNVDIGNIALGSLNPVGTMAGIMGNTLAGGLGISKDNSLSGKAMAGLMSMLGKAIFGPVGMLTSAAAPVAVDAVKDAFDMRSFERVRDYSEDTQGYFSGRKSFKAGTEVADNAVNSYESAYQGAMDDVDNAKTPEQRSLAMQRADALGQVAMAAEEANSDLANQTAMRNLREADINNIATNDAIASLSGMISGWGAPTYSADAVNNPHNMGYQGNAQSALGGAWAGLSAEARDAAARGYNGTFSGHFGANTLGGEMDRARATQAARDAADGVGGGYGRGDGDNSNGGLGRANAGLANALGNLGSFANNDSSNDGEGSTGTGSSSQGYGTGGADGGAGGHGTGGAGYGGGGSGRVVCTELVRQKLMPKKLLKYEEFHTLHNFPTYAIRGYHFWAVPYVRLMQKYKWATKLATCFIWRAEEIAYQIGKRPTGNWKGKILRWVVEPICYAIGPFVKYDKANKRWDRKDSERLLDKGEK